MIQVKIHYATQIVTIHNYEEISIIMNKVEMIIHQQIYINLKYNRID